MSKIKKENLGEAEENGSESQLKDCFIITPIGGLDSDVFKKADGLIRSVLKPVLVGFGFRALPAYEIDSTGSITKQVIKHIVDDELVIANVTGLNPNVMYELAIRHSFKKKVITMAEKGTQLPFDITDQRTLFYEDSLHGSEFIKEALKKAVEDVLRNEVTSNPVIDSVNEAAVIEQLSKGDDSIKYLIERLDRMERNINRSVQSSGPFEGVGISQPAPFPMKGILVADFKGRNEDEKLDVLLKLLAETKLAEITLEPVGNGNYQLLWRSATRISSIKDLLQRLVIAGFVYTSL